MEEMLEKLLLKLRDAKKIVFMGIGEEKLSDDGFGPYVTSELLDYSNNKFLFINAGIDPMSRIEDVIEYQPSHLVLVDTCTLSKPPGTVAIFERENIKDYVPISTHTIPIHIVIDLVIEKLPELTVFMIGIVPESLEGLSELNLYKEDEITLDERNKNIDLPFFEFNLTSTIQKAANQIINILKEIMKQI